LINAFREGLGELGYVEGTNLTIEYRQAESRVDRFPALADDLVGLKVDLIVATNSLAARAVQPGHEHHPGRRPCDG
jgi:putative ABC transport system substrate-binding protein